MTRINLVRLQRRKPAQAELHTRRKIWLAVSAHCRSSDKPAPVLSRTRRRIWRRRDFHVGSWDRAFQPGFKMRCEHAADGENSPRQIQPEFCAVIVAIAACD